LSGVLGNAKARVVDLEKNGAKTTMLQYTIEQASKKIQESKDLLEKYDFPNEAQIQREVDDLEQRLFAVVMSL
jgi:hypothetical protein